MIAADTSVAVAAALPTHPAHEQAVRSLRGSGAVLPAHAAIETFSVLTRLPREHATAPAVALAYIRQAFGDDLLTLSPDGHRRLLDRTRDGAIAGGAMFDAVVAATALEHEARLVTRDGRAVRTYELLGVDFRLVE